MLREILKKLLYSKLYHKRHNHHGHYGHHKYSSDAYHAPKHGYPPKHNGYGHGYYKKKGYSSHSSS